MTVPEDRILLPPQIQELLGYLNFSSGASDPQFLRNLNELFAVLEVRSLANPGGAEADTRQIAGIMLRQRLAKLAASEPAFRDVEQAENVLRLAWDEFPVRYREFHRDLLYHQHDADLFTALFMGRVCEAILAQGGPWNEDERILDGAIDALNDFIGHRPVAVLRTAQKIEPYPHEWVRPVPLYIRDVGACAGRYRAIIDRALAILRKTDPAILRDAFFDPDLLDELAFDPRAYDFDHPVNKRPNYHFGQWDPHHVDSQSRYRRFVIQQVTLDVLLERLEEPGELARDEVLFEAAAVLAGTILMASGTSGSGPDAHDSTTTLSTLLPRIAAYRDTFYRQLIERLDGQQAARLRAEAVTGKQPLAGARQHLNQQLARRRASQLEHMHLALLFARMGYPDAALEQAQIVPVASARMACEIQCRLSTAHLAIDRGELQRASHLLVEIEDFLHRAIECGALIDPWNMLGFQGQFSLFPSPENSVPDHRLDQLVELMEQIVGLYARVWSEAAARNEAPLPAELSDRMSELTEWWDRFAPTSVDSIEAFSGAEAYDSAREVSGALAAFHQAGGAAGDIGFWRKRVGSFNSPKAYALVVAALCQQPDLVAAMALLMQWLSQTGLIPLKQGEYSFHTLAERWLAQVCVVDDKKSGSAAANIPFEKRNALIVRFFELFEANAEDYWQVPTLELLGSSSGERHDERQALNDEDSEDGGDDDLYSAAYDEVVYIDSTADGVEADMLESGAGHATDLELEQEARRVGERLALLQTVATLWKQAAAAGGPASSAPLPAETLTRWLEQAQTNERGLLDLLSAVSRRRVPDPSNTRDSLLEFDRRRAIKESLTEKIVTAAVEVADAARVIRTSLAATPAAQTVVDELLRAMARSDREEAIRLWPDLLTDLQSRTLLYVPLNRGGDPRQLVETRVLHQLLRHLLRLLPRLGMLAETCQLLEACRMMESNNPVGPGAISEYDRLFSAGYESLVESLVAMSENWNSPGDPAQADNELVECLERLTESLLKQWLAHSRTLRLSVLERIGDEKAWQALVNFVERYGGDLFTQRFLNLGNLRAILHQGVEAWLERLTEDPSAAENEYLLLEELGKKISRAEAAKQLSLIIEAVVENYAEYRDYNSTTVQSDRGEMLYTLLDFLRLRVQYDRVAWHLKPVLIAHAVLVRRGRSAAAEMWRQALAERTGELADSLQKRGAELRKQYAMRLPTVTDRLAERFIQPLVIDRMRALVKPAMDEVRQGITSDGPFMLLEQEAADLTREPTGVGLEVPAWLAALEQEVSDQIRSSGHLARAEGGQAPIAQVQLSSEDAQRQLSGWERHPR